LGGSHLPIQKGIHFINISFSPLVERVGGGFSVLYLHYIVETRTSVLALTAALSPLLSLWPQSSAPEPRAFLCLARE
jgi:hypothetical protein